MFCRSCGKHLTASKRCEECGSELQPTYTIYVAGVKYYGLLKVSDEIKEGTHLILRPDPTNLYDKNAVRVELPSSDGPVMLGYIPRAKSEEISSYIKNCVNIVVCEVTKIDLSQTYYKQLEINIREESRNKCPENTSVKSAEQA